jgi:hypothetical protein
MSATTFPVTDLVLFLSARKVPRAEIDRIVVVLITYKRSSGDLVAKIGATHVNTVRVFMKLEREKMYRRKRIREMVASTVASMEGEDVATKRARLESVMLAVHTLGSMSQSTR